MRFKISIVIIVLSLLQFSCSSENQKIRKEALKTKEKPTTVETVSADESQIQKTIKLDNGFEILVGDEDDFDSFKTYALFRLYRNGKEIYQDSSLTEYEFGDKLYPLILPLGNNRFEIMVEVNDRPNKNYLKLFKIKDDKLIEVEKLPTFIAPAKNLDSDGDLEFAGFWDSPQVTSDKNGREVTAYNPIIYFQVTKNGLSLDSTLTIDRNKEIYGEFSGFEFMESIEVPTTTSTKHKQEIERVDNKK